MLSLVSASDTVMLNFLSQDAMSAVSLATQITFVESLFLAALTLGLSMFAAQFWGKKDLSSLESVFAYVMKITFLVSFAFFFAALLFSNALMRIFTTDSTLIEYGSTYLKFVSLSFLLTGVSQIYLCVLKNTGKAVLTSIIGSTSVIINIILNAILIFGLFNFPKLGVAGAAIATVTSKIIETFWCIATINKNRVKLKLKKLIRCSVSFKRNFWKYVSPILCNEIVWGLGFTAYSVILGHLGSDAVAANSVATVVKNIVACFSLGIGSGGGILVGNELGAGKLPKAKEYGDKLYITALIGGLTSGIVLAVITPTVLQVVSLNDTATKYLRVMLYVCSFNLLGYALNSATISGIFCSGGDTKFGLRCDFIVMWCITVPLGCISAFVFKLPVEIVFLIVNLDELTKVPAAFKRYKKYKWVKDLTPKKEGIYA